MARRSDHTRDELKALILKTSSSIIEKEGFSALTARRIAKDIGYTPGTIYNLFDSMADLCLEINGITLDRLYETLSSEKCRSPKKTPVQNMKKMAQMYKEFSEENHAHWLMLFTYALPEGKELPPWYQEKIVRLFEPLENLLIPYYSVKQTKRRKMAARTLWASVHGIFFLEETGKISLVSDQDISSQMTNYLIDNFIYGIHNHG